jgi:hypothetical protein
MCLTLKLAIDDGNCYSEQCLSAELDNIKDGIEEFKRNPSYVLAYQIGDTIAWVMKSWLMADCMKDEHLTNAIRIVIDTHLGFKKYLEEM